MKQESQLRNEDGAVLVVALIVLVLVTILGITISSTSEVELQIAGNDMRYKENLYRAEAAAMECAQFMDETGEIDTSISDDYIIPYGGDDGDEIFIVDGPLPYPCHCRSLKLSNGSVVNGYSGPEVGP